MAYTYAEQLDSVQAAIAAIESGAQEYTHRGRTYKRADLGTLYAREERLLKLVNSGSGSRARRTVAEL